MDSPSSSASGPRRRFFRTHTAVRGSVQDPMGKTGLAHMFEHMAFKGTDTIGRCDYAGEKVALAKVGTCLCRFYCRARQAGRPRRSQAQAAQDKKLESAIAAADKFSAAYNNEFGKIVESEGGEGMNAFTDPRPGGNPRAHDNQRHVYDFTIQVPAMRIGVMFAKSFPMVGSDNHVGVGPLGRTLQELQ